MLSAVERRLVDRDPEIAALVMLLDAEAFGTWLGNAIQRNEISAELSYIRYKPGSNCLVAYKVRAGDEESVFYAKAGTAEDWEKLRKAKLKRWTRGKFGSTYLLGRDAPFCVWEFPNDGNIKSLARFSRDPNAINFAPHDFSQLEFRALSYKPERRYVCAAFDHGVPKTVIKLYADDQFEDAKNNAKALSQYGRIRVPQILARSNRRRAVAFEWLDGDLLKNLISTGDWEASCRRAGRTIANMHSRKAPPLRLLTREEECLSLTAVAEFIAAVHPDMGDRTISLAKNLSARISERPQLTRPIHGDFSAKQIVDDGQRSGILDFDRSRRGDPASDLGLFLADFKRDALLFDDNAGDGVEDAMLSGYREEAALPEGIELYTAVGMLRIMPDSFKSFRPGWETEVEQLLRLAEKTANRPRTPVIDPAMPYLEAALDSSEALPVLKRALKDDGLKWEQASIIRHKPGRRCLIRYRLNGRELIGKIRAKGVDREMLAHYEEIYRRTSGGGPFRVSRPLGIVPEYRMWLQDALDGASAGDSITPASTAIAERIARGLHALHQLGIEACRTHTVADELDILEKRLALLPGSSTLLSRCKAGAQTLDEPAVTGIHRDFYHDQVLSHGDELYFLDFDLFSMGDPALDVGNFLAHLTELSLRRFGDPSALSEIEHSFIEEYVAYAGERVRNNIAIYRLLSLARLAQISTLHANRQKSTSDLIDLCDRLILHETIQT
ncbi:MAG: phosphotransferase [Fimbriimonadales bacterium]